MNPSLNVELRPLALITGASSGIGEVFARKLAARGYDLILVARRKDRLETLGDELQTKHGIRVESIQADLVDDADRVRVEERIRQAPNLEFLINNAGFGTLRSFWIESLESQDSMHRLHVLTTMRLTHEALPVMIARGKGFVVNVSSVSGFVRENGGTSYASTKAWMNRFSETLASELRGGPADVRVQALCPGFTYTEFHDVLNMDRSFIGKSWWMSAEFVVDESLAGLERNKTFVIPGWRYKVMVFLLTYLPKWMMRILMSRGVKNRAAYVKGKGSREGSV
jgi:hypothetical protein